MDDATAAQRDRQYLPAEFEDSPPFQDLRSLPQPVRKCESPRPQEVGIVLMERKLPYPEDLPQPQLHKIDTSLKILSSFFFFSQNARGWPEKQPDRGQRWCYPTEPMMMYVPSCNNSLLLFDLCTNSALRYLSPWEFVGTLNEVFARRIGLPLLSLFWLQQDIISRSSNRRNASLQSHWPRRRGRENPAEGKLSS